MEWSRWHLFKDKSKDGSTLFRIRAYRVVDGKQEWKRLERSQYNHLTSEIEIREFLGRLNHRWDTDRLKAKAAYEFKHRFITQEIKDEFRDRLSAEIPQQEAVTTLYMWLEKCVLHWFINQLGKPDPLDWKLNDKTWGLALMSKLEGRKAKDLKIWGKPVHPNTIKAVRQIANRFLAFLHEKLPKEVPAISLEPVNKANMRLYKANYNERPGRFILTDHWRIIEREIHPSIRSYVQIGYYYGLRRAECLAICTDDLYEDHLDINRQMRGVSPDGPRYTPLKSRETRQVPHWNIKPQRCYDILSAIGEPMHPTTFSELFKSELKRLREKYKDSAIDCQLHDLRRSFITNSFSSGHMPREIQLAAGHTNIETTMKYAQDDRQFAKKRFIPKAG